MFFIFLAIEGKVWDPSYLLKHKRLKKLVLFQSLSSLAQMWPTYFWCGAKDKNKMTHIFVKLQSLTSRENS